MEILAPSAGAGWAQFPGMDWVGSQAGRGWEFLEGQPGLTSVAAHLTFPFRDGSPWHFLAHGEEHEDSLAEHRDKGSRWLLSRPPEGVGMDREKVGKYGGSVTGGPAVSLWAWLHHPQLMLQAKGGSHPTV